MDFDKYVDEATEYSLRALKTSMNGDGSYNIGTLALCIIQSDMCNLSKIVCANTCAHMLLDQAFIDLTSGDDVFNISMATHMVEPAPFLPSNDSDDILTVIGIDRADFEAFTKVVGESKQTDKSQNDIEFFAFLDSLSYPVKYTVCLVILSILRGNA
jgi:hypothetical protein